MKIVQTGNSPGWRGKSLWLLVGVLLGLAGGRLFRVLPAAAQLPDAAAQRNALVAELKAANSKLDALYRLVASGKVQVRVVEAEADVAPGTRTGSAK